MKDLWPARRTIQLPRHVNLQWKGTDAVLDFNCPCGTASRYGGWFLTFIRCPGCKHVFYLNNSVEVVELNGNELAQLSQQDQIHCGANEDDGQPNKMQLVLRELPGAKVWPIDRAQPQPVAAHIHWDQTSACVDFYCVCESDDHFCQVNSHFLGCSDCNRVYWLTPKVEALRLTAEELAEHGDQAKDPVA